MGATDPGGEAGKDETGDHTPMCPCTPCRRRRGTEAAKAATERWASQPEPNGHVREDDAAMVELLQRQGAFTQASALRADVASLVAEKDGLAKRLGATQLRLGAALSERRDLEEQLRRDWNDALRQKGELESARLRIEELEAREAALLATQADNAVFMEDQKKRIESLEAIRSALLNGRSGGDAVARSLTDQLEKARKLLQDQEGTIAYFQAENWAIRSLVDLTRAAFKHYSGDDQEWDSDTPGELLTTWDQFVEILDRLS